MNMDNYFDSLFFKQTNAQFDPPSQTEPKTHFKQNLLSLIKFIRRWQTNQKMQRNEKSIAFSLSINVKSAFRTISNKPATNHCQGKLHPNGVNNIHFLSLSQPNSHCDTFIFPLGIGFNKAQCTIRAMGKNKKFAIIRSLTQAAEMASQPVSH